MFAPDYSASLEIMLRSPVDCVAPGKVGRELADHGHDDGSQATRR